MENLASVDKENLIDATGGPVEYNVLQSSNMAPLLNQGYNKHNLEQEVKLVPPLAFDKLLDAPVSVVSNLNIQPGDRGFVFWFTVSSFLPLVSACVAPLANMISIFGLAESWKRHGATGEIISDPTDVLVLNVLSLCFGLMGNISLFVNFQSTKIYIVAQAISIFCWIVAFTLLLVAVLIFHYRDLHHPYVTTEGFWFATFTIAFYFSCTVTMALNCLGFILGKYPPLLNLNKSERSLMIYTVCLAVWVLIGALVSKKLISDIDYGSSLYFCVVSVLTIGLGDITPPTNNARAFILIFALTGVVFMGLIIAMVRQVLHRTKEPILLWHRIELKRQKVLKVLRDKQYPITSGDAFTIMRDIHHKLKIEEETISLLVTLFIFFLFWLIGAVVFHFVEGWMFFDAFYFCLLCLITIGYGDFAPHQPLGRVFFVSWAISAVPLMTILISNMGDAIFGSAGLRQLLSNIGNLFTEVFMSRTDRLLSDPIVQELESIPSSTRSDITPESFVGDANHNEVRDDTSANDHQGTHLQVNKSLDSTSYITNDTMEKNLIYKVKSQKNDLTGVLNILNQLKPVLQDTLDSPSTQYDHQLWKKLIKHFRLDDNDIQPPQFLWLDDASPMRLPLQEPNYFISRIFYDLEVELLRLIHQTDTDLQTLEHDHNNPH